MTSHLWTTVKAALKASNLTQQEIADRADLTQAAVSLLMSGKTHEPTVSTLERLAAAAGLEIVVKKSRKSP